MLQANLLNHLWQSTVFAVAAGLLTLALRNNRAPVRYWLWFAASVKFLIPFSVLVMVGSQFELRPARPSRPLPIATLPLASAIDDINLASGEHLTERVTAVRGTAGKPDVMAKSRDLIAPVLGAAVCEKLIGKIFDLEAVKDVGELRPLLQR